MNTLLLDRDTWGLCVDAQGNIAMASNPYALAQDAASAIKAFKGEVWYDTTQGVPYLSEILGLLPPISLLKALFEEAALTVPEVTSATCYLNGFNLQTRQLTGQVQVSDSNGVITSSGFAVVLPVQPTVTPTLPDVSILNATL